MAADGWPQFFEVPISFYPARRSRVPRQIGRPGRTTIRRSESEIACDGGHKFGSPRLHGDVTISAQASPRMLRPSRRPSFFSDGEIKFRRIGVS